MTILRRLGFFGRHPRRGWEFVGGSWDPDAYVRVCVEGGIELPHPEEPPTDVERDEAIRQDERERIAFAIEERSVLGLNRRQRYALATWLRHGARP